MCYETSARPPIPPVAGGAPAEGQSLTLRSEDGNEFRAYAARAVAEGEISRAVVILPDVRGLHPFYEDLARRFGDLGIHAVAIDYFGRTAGRGERDDSFEFMPHVEKLTPDQVQADVAAAIAHSKKELGATRVFTVGFCMGGRASFSQSWRQEQISGAIGFYGRVAPRDEADSEAPLLHTDDFRAPVLGLFGGADSMIPEDSVRKFEASLKARGVECEIVVYPGAPHSFFDRSFKQFTRECDDAWRRMLAFVESYSR